MQNQICLIVLDKFRNGDNLSALEHIANPSEDDSGNNEAALSVGDIIKSDNGIKSAGKCFGDLLGSNITFPITGDAVGTGQPSHAITGFMTMHITGIDATPPTYSLTGTLVPSAVGGGYNPGGQQSTITTYAPFLVRLIQ